VPRVKVAMSRPARCVAHEARRARLQSPSLLRHGPAVCRSHVACCPGPVAAPHAKRCLLRSVVWLERPARADPAALRSRTFDSIGRRALDAPHRIRVIAVPRPRRHRVQIVPCI
jgi:hypothetical protein